MNAPLDHANVEAAALSGQSTLQPTTDLAPAPATGAPSARETAPAHDDKICWIEMHQVPYPPNQQVELLHLQAEAEALLLQLQAMHQRRHSARAGAAENV
ncbi:hypothetical protein IQ265_08965 [Nodosilinea sp. LEGE 06152]|uniref:hypothetical protein n=1 Tax=Nodosilinea sp. LEGE 06152 TaxID=2777966 RepID=UPI001882C594|nr:hypothetical protein [Nodosilinea sp. LEGE 06152]MBE9156957.1 hypothetical protein [Nodosilinea sp. LEGE 06152]